MNETLISFETAKLAKEKGFTAENKCGCRYGWMSYSKVFSGISTFEENDLYLDDLGNHHLIERPTQSLLQKWLREDHKIVVYITPDYNPIISKIETYYGVVNNKFGGEEFVSSNNTYEASLEAGLYNALQLIK